MLRFPYFIILFCIPFKIYNQDIGPYRLFTGNQDTITGYQLIWHDEFNKDGKPDTAKWRYESGFVRNRELQWYQQENANCKDGLLIIEGRKQKIKNPGYDPERRDWRKSREYAYYTSSSIQTKGLFDWQYGRVEVRARIDTTKGSWPAIWTLGITDRWPFRGEVDIMEFYRIDGIPHILANAAWGSEKRDTPIWDTKTIPLSHFISKDTEWDRKFHTWAMEWDSANIKLFLDGELLNTISLTKTRNPDGSNPFMQPHFLLLNLAIGANGGNPKESVTSITYEIDYVRVYRKSE